MGMGTLQHVVMVSSGCGSAVAAKRVATMFPDDTVMLFADVNGEDPDNYRFLLETWEWVGVPLVILDNAGRTIWDVFRKGRFLGNSRADLCSRILKREVMRAWLDENRDPASTVVHIGYDLDEGHRVQRAAPHWVPWRTEAPLCWEPAFWKDDAVNLLAEAGIAPPLLTRLGYPHANCGGMCVKMGHKQALKTLRTMPERYAEWEEQEEAIRDHLDKDVAIMRDRTGGGTTPLTLRRFRLRLTGGTGTIEDDWGSCNCMGDFGGSDDDAEDVPVEFGAISAPAEVRSYLTERIRPTPERLRAAERPAAFPLFGATTPPLKAEFPSA